MRCASGHVCPAGRSELGTGASAHRLSGARMACVIGTQHAHCVLSRSTSRCVVLQATFALRAISELGTGASAHRLSGTRMACVIGTQHAHCVLSRRTSRCVVLQATFALRADPSWEPGLAPSAQRCPHGMRGWNPTCALRVVAENIAIRCASGHVCPAGRSELEPGLAPIGSAVPAWHTLLEPHMRTACCRGKHCDPLCFRPRLPCGQIRVGNRG